MTIALVTAAMAAAMGVGQAEASPVRSCGDLPENSQHIGIWNVTTRGLSRSTARRATLTLFRCSTSTCSAAGYRFRCRNLAGGESVDERCVAGEVVVRFQTGV